MNWIINQQVDGYLAIAIFVSFVIGAIIFSWLSKRKLKEEIRIWVRDNLEEKIEIKLMEFVKRK